MPPDGVGQATATQLQSLCEQGQDALERTDYLRAESLLIEADRLATNLEDYDTLGRLYMPLQEARRQRRQRCGEGVVAMDLIASNAQTAPDPARLIEQYPHGQFLVAGWGSVAPAAQLRELQHARGLYAETILAAAYALQDGGRAVVLVPFPGVTLPPASGPVSSIEALRAQVPSYCVTMSEHDLPRGTRKGTWQTYAEVMALWEQLHKPFLTAADAGVELLRKIDGYRRTIEVDYACELAHQNLAAAAFRLAHLPRHERDCCH